MSGMIFDFDDGDVAFTMPGGMAFDLDGNMMIRMSDHVAMDMDSGDIHFTSSWEDEEEDF